MFIVVRNPMYRLIALGVSLVIAAIIYFAVIKPNNDTANSAVTQSQRAVTQAEQQVQQALQNANKASGGAVPASAQQLTACIVAAGTDTGKISACQAKYHP
jgi:type II secretory pathway component PulM